MINASFWPFSDQVLRVDAIDQRVLDPARAKSGGTSQHSQLCGSSITYLRPDRIDNRQQNDQRNTSTPHGQIRKRSPLVFSSPNLASSYAAAAELSAAAILCTSL
jgi:hypothetical protein